MAGFWDMSCYGRPAERADASVSILKLIGGVPYGEFCI